MTAETGPLFSICIPYYNVDEEMLKECLGFVSSQSFDDFEAIVVDDGSDWRHANLLDRIVDGLGDDRFGVLHVSHAGLYEARRSAYRVARGEYIVNLDSDDRFFDDRALGRLADALGYYSEPDVLMFNAACDPEGRVLMVDHRRLWGGRTGLSPMEFLEVFDGTYAVNSIFLKCFKRGLAKKVTCDAPGLVMCEDRLHTIQIIPNAASITILDDVLIYYRQNDESSVHRAFEYAVLEQQELVERCVMDALRGLGFSDLDMNARLKWIVGDLLAVRGTIPDKDERFDLYRRIGASDYFTGCWSEHASVLPHPDAVLLSALLFRGSLPVLDALLLLRLRCASAIKSLLRRF